MAENFLLELKEETDNDFCDFLPVELSLHLFSFLEAQDLFNSLLVCKKWLSCLTDANFWRCRYYSTWISVPEHKKEDRTGRAVKCEKETQEVLFWRHRYFMREKTEAHWKTGRFKIAMGKVKGDIWGLGMSDDGSCLLTGSHDNCIRSFHFEDGKLVNKTTFSRLTDEPNRFLLIRENLIVGYSIDSGNLRTWKYNHPSFKVTTKPSPAHSSSSGFSTFNNFSETKTHHTPPSSPSLSLKTFLTQKSSTRTSQNILLPARTFEMQNICTTQIGRRLVTTCILFENNTKVALGQFSGSILLQSLQSPQTADSDSTSLDVELIGHLEAVRTLASNDQLGLIASGSLDKSIKVWDYRTKECLATLIGHKLSVTCLSFLDSLLFSGSGDKSIRIWKTTGECLQVIETGKSVHALCVDPYQKRILSGGGSDTFVHTWEVNEEGAAIEGGKMNQEAKNDVFLKRGVCLPSFHASGVSTLCLVNDHLFISGSRDASFHIWNFESNSSKPLLLNENDTISSAPHTLSYLSYLLSYFFVPKIALASLCALVVLLLSICLH